LIILGGGPLGPMVPFALLLGISIPLGFLISTATRQHDDRSRLAIGLALFLFLGNLLVSYFACRNIRRSRRSARRRQAALKKELVATLANPWQMGIPAQQNQEEAYRNSWRSLRILFSSAIQLATWAFVSIVTFIFPPDSLVAMTSATVILIATVGTAVAWIDAGLRPAREKTAVRTICLVIPPLVIGGSFALFHS